MNSQIDYLRNGLTNVGITLDDDKLIKMLAYKDAVLKANEHVNLTSITDDEQFIELHIIDSLTLLTCIDMKGSIMDVGTGAGIPGMILKIAEPSCDVTLLDSSTKRLDFIERIKNEFSDSGVTVLNDRAEIASQNKLYREQFDICISRAVAALPVLCEYCLPFVKKGGLFIAMKGKNISEEVDASKRIYPILGAELLKTSYLKLPYSDSERNLIIFKKLTNTPQKYPRNNSVIKKENK